MNPNTAKKALKASPKKSPARPKVANPEIPDVFKFYFESQMKVMVESFF